MLFKRWKAAGRTSVSDGEDQEDDGGRQIEDRHEGEDDERRQDGDDQLRQVLAEERVELLDAVDHGERRVAGSALVEVAGAEAEDVLIQLPPHADLHQGGRGVGDLVAREQQRRADEDEDADERERRNEE